MWSRQKFILIIGGSILVTALIVFGIVSIFTKKDKSGGAPEGGSSASVETQAEQKTEPPKNLIVTPEEEQQFLARQAVTAFVTRFGTYSNHAGDKNFEGLDQFATPDALQGLEKYRTAADPDAPYIGVTTRVSAMEIRAWVPGVRAAILAHTLREEEKADDKKTYSQDALVGLIKNGNNWLVSSMEWVE